MQKAGTCDVHRECRDTRLPPFSLSPCTASPVCPCKFDDPDGSPPEPDADLQT